MEGKKLYVQSGGDAFISSETSRAIRKIMEMIEKYTDYKELPDEKRDIIRDTILNQINKLSRVIKHKQTLVFNGSQSEDELSNG